MVTIFRGLLFLFCLLALAAGWYFGRRRKSVPAGLLVAVSGLVLSTVLYYAMLMIRVLTRGLFPHGPP